MNSRNFHKTIGLILILPMLAWVITGLIFFIKPGYQAAYQPLLIKTYPLEKSFTLPANKPWQEVRLLKTILGYHLLVKSADTTTHLDPISFIEQAAPTEPQFKLLIEDAIADDKTRYGDIININGMSAKTNTGVDIKLNWQTLKLRQSGQDTELINVFYKIHYLQWTPYKMVNQVLGIVGLILLLTLTILGMRLYLTSRALDDNQKE